MTFCPFCQWGKLIDTVAGYYCPVCEREYTLDMLIIYDQEKDEERKSVQDD